MEEFKKILEGIQKSVESLEKRVDSIQKAGEVSASGAKSPGDRSLPLPVISDEDEVSHTVSWADRMEFESEPLTSSGDEIRPVKNQSSFFTRRSYGTPFVLLLRCIQRHIVSLQRHVLRLCIIYGPDQRTHTKCHLSWSGPCFIYFTDPFRGFMHSP